MIRNLKSALKTALKDRNGTAGIEFAIAAPAVLLLFLGSVTVFDIFRSYQRIVEANGVIADVISRQTSVNKTDLDNMYGVFTNLQPGAGSLHALRITSVIRNGQNFSVAWSKVSGDATLLPIQKLDLTTLPNITAGDSVIYVEGSTKFSVLVNLLGFGHMTYHESAFTRPRFIGAVAFTGS